MIPTTRLLTTVSVVNLTCRCVHIRSFGQELQIIPMKEISSRHLLLESFRKSASVPEALYSTYLKILEDKSSRKFDYEFKRTIMEPFLEMCFGQPNDSSNVSASESLTGNNSGNNIQNIIVDVNNHVQKRHDDFNLRKYKEVRQWKSVDKGKNAVNSGTDFILRLLSYNILAQNLLETHFYLYKHHNKDALDWKLRKLLVQQEINSANANVICIQEMQQEHLDEFLIPFRRNNYGYLYKKRTNDTKDGLLLLYRSDQFNVEDYVYVEYHQTSLDILNRDNVGIVVKFSLKDHPQTQIVISTTHLLYNPKRNDVRLAQIQVLFAELERIAFIENSSNGPKYHPIVFCGDLNLQPFTGVYEFITEGAFKYIGKGRGLEDSGFRRLSNALIPPALFITDNCQHFNVLTKRLRGVGSNKIMINHSKPLPNDENSEEINQADPYSSKINPHSMDYQRIEIINGQFADFSSGLLTHPFKFKSVYKHLNDKRENEATTHQEEWITVDYIFFSDIQLLDQYSLPTVSECMLLGTIPNFVVGSDHLCLGATFKLKKNQTSR